MAASPALLRTAVVGLGPMGMHHVRAAADMADTKLVAVVDIDHARANQVAQQFQCQALYNAADLVGLVDTVTIATPPEFHASAAIPLLNAGIACLIEKPLALNEAECAAIIQAATKTNTPVAVGHIERFNPATEALFAAGLRGSDIKSITVERFSPAAGRQMPVDVVSDMMIHDLEIVLALKGCDVVSVSAEGVIDDWATAVLNFSDGTAAHLRTNRKAHERKRKLILNTTQGEYKLDFMARQLSYITSNISTAVTVHEHDALRGEIADFLAAVRTKSKPRVTAADAARTMYVARQILKAIGK